MLLLLMPLCVPASAVVSYRITAQNARVDVLVWKRGLLAGFGHDHVISAGVIQGSLLFDKKRPSRSRFELSVPVSALRIDTPAARQRFRRYFPKPIDQRSRQATRANMLKKIFATGRFPRIIVRSSAITGIGPDYQVHLQVRLNGVERTLVSRVVLGNTAGVLSASGHLKLDLAAFGIKPVSAVFGTIKIKRHVDIYFSYSQRLDRPPGTSAGR